MMMEDVTELHGLDHGNHTQISKTFEKEQCRRIQYLKEKWDGDEIGG